MHGRRLVVWGPAKRPAVAARGVAHGGGVIMAEGPEHRQLVLEIADGLCVFRHVLRSKKWA